jgi:hypothetical protein
MRLALAIILISIFMASAQAFGPRHFGGSAVVVTSDLWVDPQGNLVTDPQGNNISWPN